MEQKSNRFNDVTIIINCYKTSEDDLKKSLHSCLNQMDVDIRIIVVTVEDDPSIAIIAHNYGDFLSEEKIRIEIIPVNEHPGKGPKGIFYQFNVGLKAVKTRFFSYFSSNDVMLPNKIITELQLLSQCNAIVCFSNFNIVDQTGQLIKTFSRKFNGQIEYNKLLIGNFINDCALVDLDQLGTIEFNYEKYENTCYWDLWLTVMEKYGPQSICYNPIPSWNYVQDPMVSQHLNRHGDQLDWYYNTKEFMLSYHNRQIRPGDRFNYDPKNQKIWWWNDIDNVQPITVTVALPITSHNQLLSQSLDSLKNQTEINFAWELICFEESGDSRAVIQQYVNQLPGCARIIHKLVDPCPLIEKWVNMAKFADNNSIVYIKQMCDQSSCPDRLKIHHLYFRGQDYLWHSIIDDQYRCHLALRTSIVKRIQLNSIADSIADSIIDSIVSDRLAL